MTDPIRSQIANIDGDLTSRHTAIMSKLQEILDAAVPPVDYSDSFNSLASKLDTIATRQLDTTTAVGDLTTAFESEVVANSTRWNALLEQQARLTTMDDNLQQVQQTLGVHTGGAEFTLASLTRATHTLLTSLYALLDDLGAPWPENVLTALECVCTSVKALLPIDPLDPTNPEGCPDAYTSSGLNLFPTIIAGYNTALIYATWSEPLPPGITWGLSGLGALDDGVLSSSDWSRYRVFVQSNESQYADDPTSPTRYPTNTWRALSGSGPKVFSVSERGSIKVYLCYLPPECIDTTTTAYVAGSTWGSAYLLAQWDSGVDSAGGVSFPADSRVILEGNFNGWTITSEGGSTDVYTSTSVSASPVGVVTAEAPFTFTTTTSYIYLLENSANGVYHLCPPGEV